MFAAVLGVVVGVLAGLFPGFHTNLFAVLVAGLHFDAWTLAVFLVALAVSRSVVDVVPAVFLGASEDVMALLPGHRMLRKGCGFEAVLLCVAGSVLGVIAGVFLVPVFILVFPFLFNLLTPWLFWLLLAAVLVLLFRDSWWSFVVFAFSGVLGLVVLDGVREPLFPLLSGLFGASGLVLSIVNKVQIVSQNEAGLVKMRPGSLFFSVLSGVLAGSVVTLFPGLGPSQAAALAQIKRMQSKGYLVLVGALGTVDVLISLVTFFVVGKARNGAVVVIDQLLGQLSSSALLSLIAVACMAAGFAAVFALFVSRWYASLVENVDYSVISSIVLVVLLFMSYWLSGWLGVLTFLTAALVGLIAPLTRTARSHSMGCLLLPVLIMLFQSS